MAVKKKAKNKAAKKKKALKKKAAKKKTAKKAAPKKKAAKKKAVPKRKALGKKAMARRRAAIKEAAATREAKVEARVEKIEAEREEAPKKPVPRRKGGLTAREFALKRQLLERRGTILKEAQAEIAKYIKGENRQLVETALDDGDWSVVDLSEDISLRQLGTHRETLRKIDEALRKIDEGTYGICEECGEEINANRLKILPFAILCRDCQEKKEELEAAERWESIPYGP